MTVTVFTNPNNPQCEATEQELSKLGVRYVAVDLTQNPSTFEQIKNAGFKQIPVVISPNSSWSGHRPTSSANWPKASRRNAKPASAREQSPRRPARPVHIHAIRPAQAQLAQSIAAQTRMPASPERPGRHPTRTAYIRPAVDGSIFMV